MESKVLQECSDGVLRRVARGPVSIAVPEMTPMTPADTDRWVALMKASAKATITKPRRHAYSAEYKLKIVREALKRPPGQRIKPTCRDYPDIEPVHRAALLIHSARPT